ncbi:unnamed protein product [Leptidea sinapis]|uniref:Uncharacterized protein n=1 Tax=Leptidea sinapis TaxID=189913 RepID=A0A5E4QJ40_9NEOP|nr:unnamed protein product [Leptidea sinapis]
MDLAKQENSPTQSEIRDITDNSANDRVNKRLSLPIAHADNNKKPRYLDDQECEGSESERSKNKNYSILLSDLPGEWNYVQIKEYVTKECGVNVLKILDKRSNKNNYQIQLRFNSEEHYKIALDKLKTKEIEGKLTVEVDDEDPDSDNSSVTTVQIAKCDTNDVDFWETDPEGLYGLKLEYLMSLEITPPLVRWIHVTNFRCDKSELRDVFEMAGRIVFCTVIHAVDKYAKIMYSHPLEAVQVEYEVK